MVDLVHKHCLLLACISLASLLRAVQCCVNIADALGTTPAMLHTAFAAQAPPRCTRVPVPPPPSPASGSCSGSGAGDVNTAVASAVWHAVVAVLGSALEHCDNDSVIQCAAARRRGSSSAGAIGAWFLEFYAHRCACVFIMSPSCNDGAPSARIYMLFDLI